jgi:hypothetical protein
MERDMHVEESTMVILRKRLGAVLKALEHKGLVEQGGHVGTGLGQGLLRRTP